MGVPAIFGEHYLLVFLGNLLINPPGPLCKGGFSSLPGDFAIPLIIVQHRHIESNDYFINYLDQKCSLTVKEADEKERIESSMVYFAPAGYHLMIEDERTFSFSLSEPVNFSRPSIESCLRRQQTFTDQT